jgi:hypothetical protein
MDARWKTPHAAPREKGGGGLVGEALDHMPRIVRVTFCVKKFVTLIAPIQSAFPKVAGSETPLGVRFTSVCGRSRRSGPLREPTAHDSPVTWPPVANPTRSDACVCRRADKGAATSPQTLVRADG